MRAAQIALRLGAAAALCAGLAACAETQLASHAIKKAQRGIAAREQQANLPKDNEPRADGKPSLYKVGEPYQIDGKWYNPREDYAYRETGVASWYGDEFHGRYTANGEIFNMHAVSAAHRTLPMPSVVRVTNLENGRSLVVRVNDRGPFVGGRIIDMSHRGADLLGFSGKGTAKVRVEILAAESRKMKDAALRGQRLTIAQLVAGAEEDPEIAAASALAPAAGNEGPAGVALDSQPDSLGDAPFERAPPGVEPKPRAAPRIPVTGEPLPDLQLAQAPPNGNGHTPPPGNGQASLQAVAVAPADAGRLNALAPALGEPARPAPRPAAGGPVYIQAGAYQVFDNAARAQAATAGLAATTLQPIAANGQRLYRVRLGPFASRAAADRALEQVLKRGYAGARIVAE